MKAAFLQGIEKIELTDTDKPSPKKGEVLVRVSHVGICGSDIHYFKTGKIGSQVVEFPFILGHEASGWVEEVGEGCKKFKGGEKVFIEPAIPCGKCEWCKSGRENICPEVIFLGTPPVKGALREYMTYPEEALLPLPEEMDLEKAMLMEVLAIGVHSVDLANIQEGEKVAIFGCGPVGLAILLISRIRGAGEIFCSELIPDRRNIAKLLGANYVMDPREVDIVSFIKNHTEGKGVEITFEAAGEQETIDQCFESMKIGGRTVIVGIPEKDKVYFNPEIRRKEPLILHCRRSCQGNRDTERTLTQKEP
ncbi:MAG: alcohol dehydrogenase catalytic domain-containing protein [Caldiserica bacterium]|nr:alcohol dehydrogenase catalytic domain-containing protein [Caldisericota bacterium]